MSTKISTFAGRLGATLNCQKCNDIIAKGERYLWATQGFRGRKLVRCLKSDCALRRSEYTTSKLAAVYEATEAAHLELDKIAAGSDIDSVADDVAAVLNDVAAAWNEVAAEYSDAADAMGDAGASMQERAEQIEDAASWLEDADLDFDAPESCGRHDGADGGDDDDDGDDCNHCDDLVNEAFEAVIDAARNALDEADSNIG